MKNPWLKIMAIILLIGLLSGIAVINYTEHEKSLKRRYDDQIIKR